jgi:hypothetical protein
MFSPIDADALERVTGGAPSAVVMMMAMVAMRHISGPAAERKQKMLDIFKIVMQPGGGGK